jgi:hypothetical protein
MAKQTGPRSAVGKLTSSRNALKKGIYTNAVLPGEDHHALEELAQNICETYAISDAAGVITVQRFLQNTLQTNRLHKAQTALIQAKMHSHSTRVKFCQEVNLSPTVASELPCWYFDDDPVPRANARLFFTASQEAKELQEKYSPDLMQSARAKFPTLWEYLMGKTGSASQRVYATIGERLATLYKQTHPHNNIQCFIDELKNDFFYELLWAENEERYATVVDGLKAKAAIDVITDPNLNKAEAALHRRQQEMLGTMLALKRENALLGVNEMAAAIEHDPSAQPEVRNIESSP